MNGESASVSLHSFYALAAGSMGTKADVIHSAEDVAKIASEALRHDILWKIMETDKVTITSIDGKYSHDLFNTDQLLGEMPNLVGTKTRPSAHTSPGYSRSSRWRPIPLGSTRSSQWCE